MLKANLKPAVVFGVVLAIVPFLLRALGKEYCLTQLTMALYYSVVVLGLSLLMGHAGQISLGHGAFFAIGGYTSAILTTYDFSRFQPRAWCAWLQAAHGLQFRDDLYGGQMLTLSPWAAFPVAMLATALIAVLIGFPALRLKGHYLAMATLGFGLIIHKLILGSSLAGAADGVTGVPEWRLGSLAITGKSSARVQNYYIACGLVLAGLLLLTNLVRSRFGRALQAIHERETAANAMGINTAAYKLKTFVLSSLLAAIAGVFLTHYSGGIGPSEAGTLKSVRYVALAAAGGMDNLLGVTAVSTLINYLSLRGWFGSYDNAVFGVLLILIVSLAPEGPLKPLGLALRRLIAAPFLAAGIGRRKPVCAVAGVAADLSARAAADDERAFSNVARETPDDSTPSNDSGEGEPPRELLTVSRLSRRFGGLLAVNDVSFQVATGHIHAVIGPNGAGKTTLFNIVSGVLKSDAGTVTFNNRIITGRRPFQIAQAGVSRTFQNPSLFLRMSVLENVMVGRHRKSHWDFGCCLCLPPQRREERHIREAALDQLAYVGLSQLASSPAGALAFGQLRMVELARALATEPELLLLDEPASGLNNKEKEDLAELLTRIRRAGVTLLLVEHDMSLVMQVSDRILVLHNGTVLAEGTPAEIQNNQSVISVYLGGDFQHAIAGQKPQVRLR